MNLSKNEIEEGQRRKYLYVKINGCPPLTSTDKMARGVSGKRLKFKGELKCNILFMGKISQLESVCAPWFCESLWYRLICH